MNMLVMQRKLDILIYITTNGALATPEKLQAVIEAGLDSIKFSVNGGTEATYCKVHGKNDFSVVKNNITWLRNYLDDNDLNVKTFISFVKCNFNKEDVDIIKTEFENLVDKIYVFECGNQGGNMGEQLLKNGILDVLKPGAVAPCAMLFNRVHITSEGYLDACCTDTDGNLKVADLHKVSLEEAWHSKVFRELRKQHMTELQSNIACYSCINNTDNVVVPIEKLFS